MPRSLARLWSRPWFIFANPHVYGFTRQRYFVNGIGADKAFKNHWTQSLLPRKYSATKIIHSPFAVDQKTENSLSTTNHEQPAIVYGGAEFGLSKQAMLFTWLNRIERYNLGIGGRKPTRRQLVWHLWWFRQTWRKSWWPSILLRIE